MKTVLAVILVLATVVTTNLVADYKSSFLVDGRA